MRRVAATLSALLATTGLANAGPAVEPARSPEPRPADRSGGTEHVRRQLIVRFRPGTRAAARAEAHEAPGARTLRDLALPRTQLVRVRPGVTLGKAIEAYDRNPHVLYAEPNLIWRIDAAPNDARFAEQWGMENTGQTIRGVAGLPDADIDAPEAWATATAATSITVGVVDSGVAHDHPDLAPTMWSNPGELPLDGIDNDANGYTDDVLGYDFVNDDADPDDDNLHGTHVAGTIGAAGGNGVGVAGVAWDVNLAALKVCDNLGRCPSSAIADAFVYAGEMGFEVVNASLGGGSSSAVANDAIGAAPDTLFVFAAGNEGSDNDTSARYPCNYPQPNIICVAATDNTDGLAWFSNVGAATVDLGAPGVDVVSTLPVARAPLALDQFQTDPFASRWTTGGTSGWGWVGSSSGNSWIHDSPGGSYPDNADTWVKTAAPVVLSGLHGCRIQYRRGHELAAGDRLSVEASTDEATWQTLDTWSGSTAGSFFRAASDASAFDGAAEAWFRFRLQTDGAGTDDGAHIDDVQVVCLEAGAYDYGYLSGTSMASPHVAGAAALLRELYPAVPVSGPAPSIKAAILDSVAPIPSLSGKTVTGGRLNVRGAIDALAPAPDPGPEPDVVIEPDPAPKLSKSLRLKAKPRRVDKGSKVRLKARIEPCGHHAGAKIKLLQKKKRGFKRIAAKATNGRCVATFTKRVRRTSRFRAATAEDADHLAATSKKARVRVV